jgi:hypothetical protein
MPLHRSGGQSGVLDTQTAHGLLLLLMQVTQAELGAVDASAADDTAGLQP